MRRFEFVFEDWIHSKVDMERPLATANRLSDGDGVVDIDDAGMLDLIPYIIRVKTADTDRAGTDAHISIKLGGKDGGESRFVELTKKNMASSNKDLFERGKTDEFKLQLVDIGSLGSVTLKSDGHRGAHLMYPTWELDSVVVVGRGATYQFNCNQTFGTKKSLGLEHKFEDPEAVVPTPASSRRSSLSKTKRKADNSNRTMHKTKQAPTEIKYIITTWTGTHKSASTDSNIEITLHGDKGTSAPFRLDKTINKRKDKFENGNDDIFREGPIPILGELTAVTLVSDNARGMGHMFSPDWLCDRVEVEEKMPGGKKYLFPNLQQRWMSKAKGLKMKLTVSAP